VSAFEVINEFRKQFKPSPLLNQPDSDDDEASREEQPDRFACYERPVSNQAQLLQPMQIPSVGGGGRRGVSAARKAAASSFMEDYLRDTNIMCEMNPPLGKSMSAINAGKMITDACWIASRAWCDLNLSNNGNLANGIPEIADLAHFEWAEMVLLQLCTNDPIVSPESLLWSTVLGFVSERQWSYRVNGPITAVHPGLTIKSLFEFNRNLKIETGIMYENRLQFMFSTIPRVNHMLLSTYATPSPDVRSQTIKPPPAIGGGATTCTSIAAMSRAISKRPKIKSK
jgi:hypothetical protein